MKEGRDKGMWIREAEDDSMSICEVSTGFSNKQQ